MAAAIWGAHDPQSDVLYLWSEYYGEADPAIHAAAIRARGEWIPGLIDPEANGRDRKDGGQLIQIYQKLGLKLQYQDNPSESGILEVGQRIRSGRLKVFASLQEYLAERRRYRRHENGQVVKDRDNLQDATRCLVHGISAMLTQTVEEQEEEGRRTSFLVSLPPWPGRLDALKRETRCSHTKRAAIWWT
ncbi:MAG: hypothetical protein ACLQU1_05680 [Bryobacteraceae bacterium]